MVQDAQDTGTANHDIHIVRGGGEKPQRYWDTVDTIVDAWIAANPQAGRSREWVFNWIVRENRLRNTDGTDCRLGDFKFPNIRRDQRLRIPEGNELGAFDVVYEANCENPPPERDILLFTTPPNVEREERGPAPAPHQVALPDYVNGGSLGVEGRNSEFHDAWNMPLLMGIAPNQPDPAARGLNRNGTGIQTVVGSAGHALTYVASVSPIPVGGNFSVITFPTFMVSGPSSADRVMNSREGGNGARDRAGENRYRYESIDVAGRDGRFDGWPFNGNLDNPFGTSERTFRDATLLPGLGVELDANGRVVNASDSGFGNNQGYYITGQNGEYVPSVTMSRVELETGRPNRFTQGEPSRPVPLRGFSNYGLAYFVNQVSIQPQIQEAQNAYMVATDPAEKRAQAQRAVELLNYQADLVGISNFNVNADVVGLANRGTPLTPDELVSLNPAERIAFQRESLIRDAEAQGITGIDRNAQPAVTPVRSASREVVRNTLVDYYVEMASGSKEREFRAVYAREVGENADYNKNDPASVRAAAIRFVDGLEMVQTMPEQGFPFEHMEHYFVKPRDTFNPVERYEYRPQNTQNMDRSVVEPAMTVIGSDPVLTSMLLSASANTDVAQSWANYDNLRVQQPTLFGSRRIHWDRAELLEGTRARGYRDSLIGTTFSREETNGIIRDLPAVREDLIASAANPQIVALRQRDVVDMATNNDNWAIGKGAPAMQMMYALAKEPDNRTLYAMEDHIRANAPTPEVAAQQIESLRRGVEYAKDEITRDMLGTGIDTIAAANARRSLYSPGVAAGQGGEGNVITETRTESVIVEQNVQTLFGHFATKPPAAQAYVRAVAGMGEEQRTNLLLAATTLPADQQLAIARAAVGSNPAIVNAMVASSSVNAETKAAFAAATGNLTAENAGTVLNVLGLVPEASAASVNAIAGNADASVAAMRGLAGNRDVASQLTAALSDAQKTDIATKANLDPSQADLWTSVAPQQVTSTVRRTVPVTQLVLPGDDISAYVQAATDPDTRGRQVRLSTLAIQDPVTQDRALREIAQANPELITAAVVQAVGNNPALANPFKGQMTRLGGDRRILGVGFGQSSAEHQLGDAIADLAYAQQRGDQAGIQRATNRINAVAVAAQAGDLAAREAIANVATAMIATEAPRNSTVSGRDALTTTLSTALAASQVNASATVLQSSTLTGDQVLTSIYSTVSNIDYTSSRELSSTTQWAVSNSQSTAGWIVPWIPIYDRPPTPDEPTIEGPDPCPGCPVVPRPQPPTLPQNPPVPGR